MAKCEMCKDWQEVWINEKEKFVPCPACMGKPPPHPIGGQGLPPAPTAPTSSGGMSDEQFRDAAIIVIYAADPQAGREWACREADALLAERNRRRAERQKGVA